MSIINARYGEFNVIDTDSVISTSLRLYGEWAQHEIDLLANFIQPGYVVVDVGAFIGTHARAFSALVGFSGKVLAFEPRQATSAVLIENAKLSPVANIIVTSVALGSKCECLTIESQHIDVDENFGALTLEPLKNTDLSGENITITTLDSYVLDRLDFIKIDVEGMELDVLNGSIETIKRCRPIIFAECNSLEASAPIIKWCQEGKYQIFGILSSAYNQHNYAVNHENIFGVAQETGLLLIPVEAYLRYEEILSKQCLPKIKTIDDLALLLLHKPQYPYEVLAHSAAVVSLLLNYPSPQADVLNQAMIERDGQITSLNQAMIERDGQITSLLASTSWRVTKPVRSVVSIIKNTPLNSNNYIKALSLIRSGRYRELASKCGSKIKLMVNQYVDSKTKFKLSQDAWQFLWENGTKSYPEIIKTPPLIDILIPVYNGYEYLTPLFESLKKNTLNGTFRLIIIDDCSTDERVQFELQRHSKDFYRFELFKNDHNLGFVGSVNKAVEKVTSDIFILLNTDTEVPAGWLERLIAPLLADTAIASVTPFSNSATICSFPNIIQDNELYLGLSASLIDNAFRLLPNGLSEVMIPTGVGFCMAINFNVVKRIGMFDTVFGRGYGEENDWCMRATSAGYKHVLLTNLFIYHKHGGSFPSDEKASLIKSNHHILLSRYPTYEKLVSDHIKSDPAQAIRQFVKLKLSCMASGFGAVLIIDHALGGGANSYRDELVLKYKEENTPVLVYVDDARTNAGHLTVVLSDEEFDIVIPNVTMIESIFSQIKIGSVIYNNAVGSSDPLMLIETITKFRERYAFEIIVLFHDFYPICPSYTLLNKDGVYCEVPSNINICTDCVSQISSRYSSYIPRNTKITEWRKCWGSFLQISDKVVCFSENSNSIVLRAYPSVKDKVKIVPHYIDLSKFRKPCIKYDRPLNIGIVGGINYAKGLDVVLGLVAEIKRRELSIYINIIGEVDYNTPIDGLFVTGKYKKELLPDIIEKLGVNVFLLPSICPETFSYVTSELILMECALVCFDIGAPADRVQHYSKGHVLSREIDSVDLLDALLAVHGGYS